MENWDSIYREKSIVQSKPSERVLAAISLFRENGLQRILDLGCGTGRHTTHLVDVGMSVYGCDSSERAISIVSGIIKDGRFNECEMTALPYEDNYFDGIICNHVLQHGMMKDICQAASEILRVLKSGGLLYLVVISTEHPKYATGEEVEPRTKINTADIDGALPHHFFTEKDLRKLFSSFEITRLEHFSSTSELNPGKQSAAWELLAQKP